MENALQNSLFEENSDIGPLAHKIRPIKPEEYIGFAQLIKRYPILNSSNIPSLIIWGPPGSGKTTLAHVLAKKSNVYNFETFSAVMGGVAELKKLMSSVEDIAKDYGKKTIIFIDEIHRFNKSQQDALLPHVEAGKFVLIGATTENPRSSLNRALLSRMSVIELKNHQKDQLNSILERAIKIENLEIGKQEKDLIVTYCDGDARKVLNNLELFINLKNDGQFTIENFKTTILENARAYDRNQDRHYDVISAFIKSLRGSDPDAALLWLAVMLDGGEDPVFIARRLVIFASEDVGNADIGALNIAVNTLQVVSQIGMPEARISLAQASTYLASTVKSNKAYEAINSALDYVKGNSTIDVPEHLKNFPAHNHKVVYQYPHNFENNFVLQQYSPKDTPQFYFPSNNGVEKNIKERLKSLWKNIKDYL